MGDLKWKLRKFRLNLYFRPGKWLFIEIAWTRGRVEIRRFSALEKARLTAFLLPMIASLTMCETRHINNIIFASLQGEGGGRGWSNGGRGRDTRVYSDWLKNQDNYKKTQISDRKKTKMKSNKNNALALFGIIFNSISETKKCARKQNNEGLMVCTTCEKKIMQLQRKMRRTK